MVDVVKTDIAGEELQVVDDQDIHAAVLSAETGHPAAPERLQETVGELLGRQVHGGARAAPAARGRPDAF